MGKKYSKYMIFGFKLLEIMQINFNGMNFAFGCRMVVFEWEGFGHPSGMTSVCRSYIVSQKKVALEYKNLNLDDSKLHILGDLSLIIVVGKVEEHT